MTKNVFGEKKKTCLTTRFRNSFFVALALSFLILLPWNFFETFKKKCLFDEFERYMIEGENVSYILIRVPGLQ